MTLNDLKWIMNILNDPKWIFSWKTQRILWESLNDPPGSGSPQGVGRTKRHGGERFVARASEQQRSFPVSTLIFGRTGRKKWPFFWGGSNGLLSKNLWTWSLDRATSCHIIGFSWDVIIDVISRYCAISFANDGTTRWHHDLWSCPSQSDNVVTVFPKVWWRKATSWARCGRFGMSRTWMNHAETMAKLPTGISLRSIKTMMIMLGITTALRHHCT